MAGPLAFACPVVSGAAKLALNPMNWARAGAAGTAVGMLNPDPNSPVAQAFERAGTRWNNAEGVGGTVGALARSAYDIGGTGLSALVPSLDSFTRAVSDEGIRARPATEAAGPKTAPGSGGPASKAAGGDKAVVTGDKTNSEMFRPVRNATPGMGASPFAWRNDARGYTLRELQAMRGLAPPRVPAADLARLDVREIANQSLRQELARVGTLPEAQRAAAQDNAFQAYLRAMSIAAASNQNPMNAAMARLFEGDGAQ